MFLVTKSEYFTSLASQIRSPISRVPHVYDLFSHLFNGFPKSVLSFGLYPAIITHISTSILLIW
jgi:hypothetical protein